MKVLVIGGSGFLGSHISDQLLGRGYEVTIYDQHESKYIIKGINFIKGDILDKKKLSDAVKGSNIVYHLAAVSDIQESIDSPSKTISHNIIGTTNVLEACIEFGVKRIMFSSSIYVYSEHGSFYRVTKQACELIIEEYSKYFGQEFTIMRYGSLYGSRGNYFNFISNSIKQALLTGKIIRKGDGEEKRDYINIRDAAELSVKALSEEYKNKFIMITGNKSLKVKEVLELIRDQLNNSIKIEYTPNESDSHYKLTPYSFKPRPSLKLTLNHETDLGEGIFNLIHEINLELTESDKTNKTNEN